MLFNLTVLSSFPDNFLWGGAIAEQQNSGADNLPDSQWSEFEKQPGAIDGGDKSGKACDFWNSYEGDIGLMAEFGLNSLRFSIAWDRIEPQEGVFNQEALDHYELLCDALIARGMTPMITLHHFAHPVWFEELGAFEKEENIKYFARFSQRVFEKLSGKVKLWCTINEPNIYAFQGYLRNAFPPKRFCNIRTAALVLRNLIKAHCDVYDALKSMPNGQESQIGLVHQYLEFEPYHKFDGWFGKLKEVLFIAEKAMPFALNNFLNDAIMEFLKTGKFELCAPGLPNKPELLSSISDTLVQRYTREGKIADFIGLNFYSRVVLELYNMIRHGRPVAKEGQVMTDMPYAIYPEAFYEAIMDVNSVGLPIYITENGIADRQDKNRARFIKSYIGQMFKAMESGADVRGYYYWSPFDNFEWDMGYRMKFGLWEVDFETQERKLREGSKAYIDIIKNSRSTLCSD